MSMLGKCLYIALILLLSTVTDLYGIDVDITNLGGDLTSSFTDRNAIQLTAPNVTDEQNRLDQLNGFTPFHAMASKKEGLGPAFVHRSCGSCHVNNGRGKVKLPPNRKVSSMVIKVSLKGLNEDGSPKNVPKVGEQLKDHHIKKGQRYDIKLTWRSVSGEYPDGTKYKLRKPRLKFRIGKKGQKKYHHSLRMTPPIIGPGLLEAIPESTILAFSNLDPEDNNGIVGRPQYVKDAATGEIKIGRFGFRASHPSLRQQSAAAAFFDIGITNPIFKTKNPDKPLEMSEEVLHLLSVYQLLAGVPTAQNQDDPEVIAGKALFTQVGCDSCHKFNIQTGPHEFSELSNQTIHPFTDLLLHDMGPGLADKRAEFSASGSEWRTTPLWGLGFSKNLSNINGNFLHDGRARTIEEAILWHGGAAEQVKNNFMTLSAEERSALLAFLNSL